MQSAGEMSAVGGADKRIPRIGGAVPFLGHLLSVRKSPISLFERVHEECGEVGEFLLGRQPVVMMYGEEAHEAFFRADDEQLDQAAAYPFMTPIFGEGVVFDGTPEQRKEALRNQALRDKMMRGHAETIADEVVKLTRGWGDAGEIDLIDFFAELTIYTSSACLLGKTFRDELSADYVQLYHDLEFGTDALAYVNPYLPLPSFRKRDRARQEIVRRIDEITERRAREDRHPPDLLEVLTSLRNEDGSRRYPSHHIAGIFISTMFAGHHTTSGTAAWTLIELLRNPADMAEVAAELDALYAAGREVSYLALREMPELEAAIKESLRLHPPLIILMRKVMRDFRYKDWLIEAGKTVAVSPAVSNTTAAHFESPEAFDRGRYKSDPRADRKAFAWLPFGAGRHRCVGAAFALMQLKAIFSVLLREFEFELSASGAEYRNDHSKMVVQIQKPCRVKYRRRVSVFRGASVGESGGETASNRHGPGCVSVDRDLCQGHAVCVSEAPEVFALDERQLKVAAKRGTFTASERNAVERAVRHCPTGALRIEPAADTASNDREENKR